MTIFDLFHPKWRNPDPDVRKKFVDRTGNQTLLAKIATSDSEKDVRKTAVKKLEDQSLLAEIAKNDKEKEIRETAIRTITDQEILIHVGNNSNDYPLSLRKLVISKIRNDTIREELKNKLQHVETGLFGSFSIEEKHFLRAQKPNLLRMILHKRNSTTAAVADTKVSRVPKGTNSSTLNRLTKDELNALIRVDELSLKSQPPRQQQSRCRCGNIQRDPHNYPLGWKIHGGLKLFPCLFGSQPRSA